MHHTLDISQPLTTSQHRSVPDMPTDMTHFARHLHELRRARGWSQPELAKMVGTSGPVIGRYERGEVTPSVDAARKIADALGATLDYMTGDVFLDEPEKDKAIQERCRALAGLPAEDLGHIFYLLDGLIRDAKARLTYS